MRHALSRCARLAGDFGAVAVVTDPIDARAEKLYGSFDFQPLHGAGERLILPMKTLVAAFEAQARLDALRELAEQRADVDADEWLTTPQPSLGGRAPSACCKTDRDFARAAALLDVG